MNKDIKSIRLRLLRLRKKAYNYAGSYEYSYTYLMKGLDKIIGSLE